jgi:hypothetical protein
MWHTAGTSCPLFPATPNGIRSSLNFHLFSNYSFDLACSEVAVAVVESFIRRVESTSPDPNPG